MPSRSGATKWIKAFLWIAVVLLPGGILLVPVLVGFHERDRRARLRLRAPDDRA